MISSSYILTSILIYYLRRNAGSLVLVAGTGSVF